MVTGGAGFIGTCLVKKLLRLGKEVVILDDFSSGRANTTGNLSSKGMVRTVRGDVRDPLAMREALEGVDTVFHLAASVSVSAGEADPRKMLGVNSVGTLSVLRYSLETGVERFIYASSAAVYGNLKPPIRESQNPAPISVYGRSKLEGEKYCLRFYQERGFPVTILRFFNVYGEGQQDSSESGVITQFARRLSSGMNLVVYGSGKQTRDFVNVDDVAAACAKVANHGITAGKTYNVGTGKPTSVNELLALEARMLGVKTQLEVVHKPARPGEIKESFADTARLRRDIGFTAKVSLSSGLRRYSKWYLQRKTAAV